MTEPEKTSLSDTAAERPEESVQHEHDVVGEQPDTGRLVTPDASQSTPDDQPTAR